MNIFFEVALVLNILIQLVILNNKLDKILIEVKQARLDYLKSK